MSADVSKLLKEIKESITVPAKDGEGKTVKDENGNDVLKLHRTSSQRDEVRVMKEMLNDREYKVGIYSVKGKEGELCPSEEARSMVSSVLSSAAKISEPEAEKLAEEHEFNKKESANLVNVSKEFVNTYLQSGRKLPLGARETTSTALVMNTTEPKTEKKNVRTKQPGAEPKNELRDIFTPSFQKVKAVSTCPVWVKDKVNKEDK